MYVSPGCTVASVIAAIADRMHHDAETERKVLRNEIAKLNRSRLERMLGPEGGYDNWA
jgi:2-oxo-4-hydroxy-4-carboxy--5-ureidoimidazoline (OHCU) decarboxylase